VKAAIFDGLRRMVVREVDKPIPKEECVIIEMKRCGICGSDLHAYFEVWEQPSYASGHEASGTIVECGPAVKGFKAGDRVCMEWFAHCDHCRYCKTGDYNLCDNLQCTSGIGPAGFAEYIVAHTSSLFRIPEGLSFEDAAMVEPLAASCRAFRRSAAGPQDCVLIVGCGTIGLLAVAVSKAAGVSQITAVAKYEHQAELARQLGAHNVLRIDSEPMGVPLAADAVIETTASVSGVRLAVQAVRKAGCLVLVGGFHAPVEVNLRDVVNKEIRVFGSSCYAYNGLKRDFEWSMDLIASGRVPAGRIVTHRFPLADIHQAFEVAADKSTKSIKVQIYS